jgi:hypothetical protein
MVIHLADPYCNDDDTSPPPVSAADFRHAWKLDRLYEDNRWKSVADGDLDTVEYQVLNVNTDCSDGRQCRFYIHGSQNGLSRWVRCTDENYLYAVDINAGTVT